MSNAVATLNSYAATGGSFSPLNGIARFFEAFGAARRSAAAIEAHRRPAARDLEILGLEGLNFENLRR